MKRMKNSAAPSGKEGKKKMGLFRILLLCIGLFLLLDGVAVSLLSNFNLGVILPAFFGVPLVIFALFLPKMEGTVWMIVKIAACAGYGLALMIFLVCGVKMLKAAHSADEAKADVLIVLGAAVHGDRVTWVLSNRLDTACSYLAEYPDAKVIVSGGQGSGETVTEASAMAGYLIAHGVDESRVYLEEQATSTKENFVYSKAIADRIAGENASLAFVTTGFHVYRSGRVAAAQGIAATGVAAPDVWYIALNNFLRECVGICVYTLRGDA